MSYDTINNDVTIPGGAEGTLLAGRYRVVRQLGQGGMGSVWLAEDTQLDNKPFAIKMLPSILVSNKRAYRQLKDEALVAMRLVHPNIVQIRAFEENNGNPFLVMDYIDGETLDDYLAEHSGDVLTQSRRDAEEQEAGAPQPVGSRVPRDRDGRARSPSAPQGGLPESDVLRLLKPIAAALDYAHSKGVVHRDVKPGNVMIAKDGTPYILDFGIAREIQETMTRVTGKLSSGTLLYMSPEQLHGASPKKEQDIYSFAAMAYECLKGEPPFVRGAIEDQIKNKIPEPPVGRDGQIAPIVAGIMAGLAKKPEDRPASCMAVLERNDLTQRRREAESQSGGARRLAGPVGSRVARDRVDAPQTGYEVSPEERGERKGFGGMAPDSALVICPVCGRKNDLKETFRCRECGRDNLCLRHQDEITFLCEDCTANREAENERLALEKFKRENGAVKTITLPGGATMEMIYVAPGLFMMGSPESEEGRDDDEKQHHVTLTKGFWLGKYPVTQKQWQSVMGRNPSYFKQSLLSKMFFGGKTREMEYEQNPVECVSWFDCQEFIRKVNASLNCGARLPTEAEWEYACRAGTSGPYAGGCLDSMGWYWDNSGGKTHPVGQKSPNPWGFYDMHGNVWEWCDDWHGDYSSGSATDPTGPASGDDRVLRGGSWSSNARYCRSAFRIWNYPGYRDWYYGFRLCCSARPRGR